MRPLKFVVALTLALSLLSYSTIIACDHGDDTAEAVVTVCVDTVVTDEACEVRGGLERSVTLIRASLRAGVNLTRALARSAAHTATLVARTVYHTATALT